jgi:hypothetical protein
MDFFIGCDLGSHVDYSAVSVLARSLTIEPGTGRPRRDTRGDLVYRWVVRALARFPLRTPYPTVARKIARIARMPELRGKVRVALDGTGVGIAVTSLVKDELQSHPEIEVWSVSISAGESFRVVRRGEMVCSKIQLIGAFAAALHSGRFRVARKANGKPIDGADLLEKELAAFKVRQSRRSDTEIMGSEGSQHDDCVLCCSVPVFLGGMRFLAMDQSIEEPSARFRPVEADALAVEHEAEQEALRRENGETTPLMLVEREQARRRFLADPLSVFHFPEDDDA